MTEPQTSVKKARRKRKQRGKVSVKKRSPKKKTKIIREQPGKESESDKEKTMTVMDLEKTPPESEMYEPSLDASPEKTESDIHFDTRETGDTVRRKLRLESSDSVYIPSTELFKLLKTTMMHLREIEISKEFLAANTDFNLTDAYSCFNQDRSNCVTISDFETGARNLGISSETEAVTSFFNLRCVDEKLSLEEFSEILLPVDERMAEELKG